MTFHVWILFGFSLFASIAFLFVNDIPFVVSVSLFLWSFFVLFIASKVYYSNYKKGRDLVSFLNIDNSRILRNVKVSFLNYNLFNQKSKWRHSTEVIYDFNKTDIINLRNGTFVLLGKGSLNSFAEPVEFYYKYPQTNLHSVKIIKIEFSNRIRIVFVDKDFIKPLTLVIWNYSDKIKSLFANNLIVN